MSSNSKTISSTNMGILPGGCIYDPREKKKLPYEPKIPGMPGGSHTLPIQRKCSWCNGRGQAILGTCSKCHGTGVESGFKDVILL